MAVTKVRTKQQLLVTDNVSFESAYRITNLLDPSAAQDAATKAYVDAVKTGLDFKDSVKAATVGTETFSITSGAVTQITATTNIDGVAISVGDRILIKNAPAATGAGSTTNTTQPANGIYVVTNNTTNLTVSRATDADSSAEVTSGMYVFVSEGTANADSGFVLITNDAITLNTTPLQFTQFSGAGQITAGDGLTKTGNTLNVVATNANRIVVNADSIDLAQKTPGTSPTSALRKLDFDAYGRLDQQANAAAADLDATFGSQVANYVYAAPNGSAGTPSFRALVAADIPALSGYLSSSALSTQSGYFGDIYLRDDNSPSHYLQVTNSANLTAARVLSIDVVDADRTISLSGNLTLANNFVTSGNFALTLTTTAATNVTLPTSGTLYGTATGSITSAQLATSVSDETGSGALVFGTSPSLTTPALSGATISTNAAVTAGTNAQGQGALTNDYNVITTAAANPSGVTLPTATVGRRVVIVNRGANPVNVFPAAGAGIDGLAANASQQLAVNAVQEYIASSTTRWYSRALVSADIPALTGYLSTASNSTQAGYFSNIFLADTVNDHYLAFQNFEDLTANRTLRFIVNNADRTINLGGNLTTSGGAITLTASATTNVTLPTSGTLISSTNFVFREALLNPNGSTSVWTLANTPVSGTEMLYVNGVLQNAGAGNDYTISGATITFLSGAIPQSGDVILITYLK